MTTTKTNTADTKKAFGQAEAMRRRFGLRRTAHGLLFDPARLGREGQHRTYFCGRGIRDIAQTVGVYRGDGHGRA